jgi:hypothetical protein
MEEIQPHLLIRELAALNPGDPQLQRMVAVTKGGYDRSMSPALIDLLIESKGSKDDLRNHISLRQNLLATLRIDKNRLSPQTKMTAQISREHLMKTQFLLHLRSSGPGKVLLRFGRNHLHRGYDGRGISTLGNFVAEFAVAQGKKTFNVGAFGAGGKGNLLGETFDADERRDELTFALLAESAKSSATLFDLRPVRPLLHAIPRDKRTAVENNLMYWADSYDALICYQTVTPLKP